MGNAKRCWKIPPKLRMLVRRRSSKAKWCWKKSAELTMLARRRTRNSLTRLSTTMLKTRWRRAKSEMMLEEIREVEDVGEMEEHIFVNERAVFEIEFAMHGFE